MLHMHVILLATTGCPMRKSSILVVLTSMQAMHTSAQRWWGSGCRRTEKDRGRVTLWVSVGAKAATARRSDAQRPRQTTLEYNVVRYCIMNHDRPIMGIYVL